MEKHPFDREVSPIRKTDYPINPLIQDRWSPRAMTGEKISDSDLNSLFEAARWAPSSYNNQPWCFLYAKRETPEWQLFFNLMIPFNQSWTKDAAVLVLAISNTLFTHNQKPCRTHSFDTGAAWMALALEGASRGFVVHGMEGFDYDKAKKDLKIPDTYQIEALIAIGKRAPKTKLPEEMQKKEAPSLRRHITEFTFEGKFKH